MRIGILSAIFLFAFAAYATPFKVIDAGSMNSRYAGSFLYVPENLSPQSHGIVLLHGSTPHKGRKAAWGGLPEHLAQNGYLVFEYCYFECPGNAKVNPYSLISYDVIDTYNALVWFNSLAIFSGKFGIYGLSRGAEQALLLTEMIGREALALQPSAVVLHAPIPYVWGAFDWRWVLDKYCWLCTDGGNDCYDKILSIDDKTWRRHLRHDKASLFVWNSSKKCGPNPRDLNLTESVSYLWNGKPIPVVRQWSKTGPQPLDNLGSGHKFDPTFFARPYMLIHGGRDLLWSPDFSKSISLTLKSFAHADNAIEQLDIRPIFSSTVADDGQMTPLEEFTSPRRIDGPYADQALWHRFYLLSNADHAFSDPRHSEIRKHLTLDFFRNHLR